jgi:hypothetical protein
MTKHAKVSRYGVRFIGYSAKIVATAGNIPYADIDFVSGATALHAEEGFVLVPSRSKLAAFVASLPLNADRLREVSGLGYHKLRCDENCISIGPTIDISCFISQITNRHVEIEQMLEQVETLGYKIERRPYADYIDELARTGWCRVVSYGVGLFVDGRLRFRPERRTALIRPEAAGERPPPRAADQAHLDVVELFGRLRFALSCGDARATDQLARLH